SRIPEGSLPAARGPSMPGFAPRRPERQVPAAPRSSAACQIPPAPRRDSIPNASRRLPARPPSFPTTAEVSRNILFGIWPVRRRRRELLSLQTQHVPPAAPRVLSARCNSLSPLPAVSFRSFGFPDDLFIPSRVIALGERQRNVSADNASKRAAFRENAHVNVNHQIPDKRQCRPRVHHHRNVP